MKKAYDFPRLQILFLSETDVLTASLTKTDGVGSFDDGVRFDWNDIFD